MHNYKKIFIPVLFGSWLLLASCGNSAPTGAQEATAAGKVKQTLGADDFEKKLNATAAAQLVDVRTPGEYAGGHLKNAVNIDIHDQQFVDRISKMDKSKPVFVYCKAGGRSATAADKMQEMGFTRIYNLDGGIMQWESSGKSLEGAAPGKPGMSQEDLAKLVTTSKYVLVDYGAKWCAPCQKMVPILESLADSKKDKLALVKIDADDNKDLLKQKGISGIPFLELYLDGKLIWKHDGYIEKEELLRETKL